MPPSLVHGFGDDLPASDLRIAVNTGCLLKGAGLRGDVGGLCDDQPSRGALRVIQCADGSKLCLTQAHGFNSADDPS